MSSDTSNLDKWFPQDERDQYSDQDTTHRGYDWLGRAEDDMFGNVMETGGRKSRRKVD
jgi:hypothetical protein